MKSGGLTFMPHFLPSAIKREGPNIMLFKQRKKLFYQTFLLFAMMCSLGLLTSLVLPNSPWRLNCWLSCSGGSQKYLVHFEALRVLNFAFQWPHYFLRYGAVSLSLFFFFPSQSLLTVCLDDYWAAYDISRYVGAWSDVLSNCSMTEDG